jgi:protein phosphatase
MRVIPGNAQHIGDRERQEDAFGFSNIGDRAFERHGGVMMVLCDGMGGLDNGAAASRAAVDATLFSYCRKQPLEDIPSALDRALREAHQAVCAICGEGGTSGSTIVLAVVWQDKLYWASLGDSRLYLCREGAPAAQLTEDHNVASLLEQRAARGESPGQEAAYATNRDALTAYLGAPYPPQPHTGRDVPLQPGDRIIACSDGLYRGCHRKRWPT